jgi:hypothetical protein
MGTSRTLFVILLLCGATLQPGSSARAQTGSAQHLEDYLKTLRGDLVARRDSALVALVQLSEAQAKTFWPLRDAYDAEALKLSDRRVALTTEFAGTQGALTAEKARAFADRMFELESERIALRRKYFDKMAADVSPVAAVQFLQLQRQFETMLDVKAAAVVPLAGE